MNLWIKATRQETDFSQNFAALDLYFKCPSTTEDTSLFLIPATCLIGFLPIDVLVKNVPAVYKYLST